MLSFSGIPTVKLVLAEAPSQRKVVLKSDSIAEWADASVIQQKSGLNSWHRQKIFSCSVSVTF